MRLGLDIGGLGMVCSVGVNAAAACAAIRAKISAPQPVSYFDTLDEALQEPVKLIGHPVPMCGEGFAGLGRLIRLAQLCLLDLRGQLDADHDDHRSWSTTGLIVVIPRLDPDRFIEAEGDIDALKQAFLGQLCKVLGLSIFASEAYVLDGGAPAGGTAAQFAASRLSTEPKLTRFLIVAVDSHLDPLTLEWLTNHKRLKSGDNPVGLSPGEAAVALLVHPTKSRGSVEKGRAQATLEAAVTAGTPGKAAPTHLRDGRLLAQAVRATLETSSSTGNQGRTSWEPFLGNVIVNLNGEAWRAAEWGQALVLLSGSLSAKTSVMIPAVSTGDVGAASMLVGVAVMVRSFARRYAEGTQGLVLSSSEYGDVSALSMSAPRM